MPCARRRRTTTKPVNPPSSTTTATGQNAMADEWEPVAAVGTTSDSVRTGPGVAASEAATAGSVADDGVDAAGTAGVEVAIAVAVAGLAPVLAAGAAFGADAVALGAAVVVTPPPELGLLVPPDVPEPPPTVSRGRRRSLPWKRQQRHQRRWQDRP